MNQPGKLLIPTWEGGGLCTLDSWIPTRPTKVEALDLNNVNEHGPVFDAITLLGK